MTDRPDIQADLERYTRAVRELRARARDARARIERADAALAEARTFARNRRRRAAKAARHHSDS